MDFTYQFTVQHNYDTVANAIRQALVDCGRRYKEKPGGGFKFRMPCARWKYAFKFVLYISETGGITTIRITEKVGSSSKKYALLSYDRFITALENCGLSIPIATGKPYIVTATQIGGGIEQQFTAKKQMSMGGAFVGGLLFGDLGAIAGAYNGKTKGKTKTAFSNSALFLICYSNGMVEEREVSKRSQLYTEVMAKLNANPVIRK